MSASIMSPGTIINKRYRIEKVLGQGGMGTVYAATDERTWGPVAVKVLHEPCCHDSRPLNRFRLEARLPGTIRHTGICQVIDFGFADGGSPFIVMPLLIGGTLKALLAGEGALPTARASRILIQTLSALQAVHDAGALHRDLKPSNIFVTPMADGSEIVRILDFGIARTENRQSAERTRTGAMMGTPHYMSPEQAEDPRRADCRSDLWSAGVVLYEAVTGRRPFDGENAVAILYRASERPLSPPSAVCPSLPPGIDEIVMKALARCPSDRYQTADEMRRALSELETVRCELEEIDTIPPPLAPGASSESPSSVRERGFGAFRRLRPGVRRYGVRVGLAIVMITLLGLMGFGSASPESARPRTPTPEVPPEPALPVPPVERAAPSSPPSGPLVAPASKPEAPTAVCEKEVVHRGGRRRRVSRDDDSRALSSKVRRALSPDVRPRPDSNPPGFGEKVYKKYE